MDIFITDFNGEIRVYLYGDYYAVIHNDRLSSGCCFQCQYSTMKRGRRKITLQEAIKKVPEFQDLVKKAKEQLDAELAEDKARRDKMQEGSDKYQQEYYLKKCSDEQLIAELRSRLKNKTGMI